GLCSAVVDLTMVVPALPERGGDVVASSSGASVGGGLNALAAAAAAGLPAAYAGGHGTGPFGDQVRAALAAHGIEVLLAADPDEDTGYTVVLVDADGERTFVTAVGAEGHLTPAALSAYRPVEGDAVYVSGYDLAYPHGPVIAAAIARLPADTVVLLDPGPLVAEIEPQLLDTVLARTTWVSLNAREAALWTGRSDATEAADDVLTRAAAITGVVLRHGSDGCLVQTRGGAAHDASAVPVERVVNTNGAGDVHVGTFVAGLARGLDPAAAARAANAAAARRVAGAD
ncbi:MAG TPA: PfkB family carbohydrate kinase, partial [Actinomycetes bacterium]|nr:PfkB family carbohydrate kinase [Actinomycetes bacterium]